MIKKGNGLNKIWQQAEVQFESLTKLSFFQILSSLFSLAVYLSVPLALIPTLALTT